MSVVSLEQVLSAGAELVPGNPDGVMALVEELQTVADRLSDEITVLEEIEAESDDADVWVSNAAALFLDLQRKVRPDLGLLAERYSVASGALSDYADELRAAQEEAAQAADDARGAQYEIDTAEMRIGQMELVQESGDEWMGSDPYDDRTGARARQAQAVEAAGDAVRRWERAAETAATAIAQHVEGDGLQNPVPGSTAALEAMVQRLQDDPSFWAFLSPEDQARLIDRYPDVIGNMDGIPALDRDRASRIYMERTRRDLEDQKAALEADNADGRHDAAIADIDRQLAGIKVIDNRLGEAPGGREAYLLGFSPEPEGRAIVAIGNPDTADNVLTYVPGTGAELSGGLNGDLKRADRMAMDAAGLDENADTATIMWLGYDAPPGIPDATDPDYAADGAGTLRDFQSGLMSTHVDGGANYTVLGHSYGSTVIGHAASGGDLVADSLVFVGSPGVGVDHVSELGIDPDRVFATNAFHDPVGYTPTPVHGPPPTRESFGAVEFRSDPGPFDLLGGAHSTYWDPGNQARENIAAIATGNPHLVQEGRETPGWFETVDVGSHADRVGEFAGDVKDNVVDFVDDTVDRAGDFVDDVKEGAGEVVDRVSDGLSDAGDAVRDGLNKIPGVDF